MFKIHLLGAIIESGNVLTMKEDPEVSKTHRAAQGLAIHHKCSSTNYDERNQVKILFSKHRMIKRIKWSFVNHNTG